MIFSISVRCQIPNVPSQHELAIEGEIAQRIERLSKSPTFYGMASATKGQRLEGLRSLLWIAKQPPTWVLTACQSLPQAGSDAAWDQMVVEYLEQLMFRVPGEQSLCSFIFRRRHVYLKSSALTYMLHSTEAGDWISEWAMDATKGHLRSLHGISVDPTVGALLPWPNSAASFETLKRRR